MARTAQPGLGTFTGSDELVTPLLGAVLVVPGALAGAALNAHFYRKKRLTQRDGPVSVAKLRRSSKG